MTHQYFTTTMSLAGAHQQLEEARGVLWQRIRTARELDGLTIAEIASEGITPLDIACALNMTVGDVRGHLPNANAH